MTDILEFVLIIIGIWLAFSAGFIIWRRCKLYKRINRLKKETGAQIKYVKPPFLSLFKISKVPEITVKLGNKIYLIRTFLGGGIGKVVHFASEEWLVRFSRLRAAGYSKRRLGEKIVNARSGFAVGTKVFRLPRLDLSAYKEDGREVIPVIIFNPAPGEVGHQWYYEQVQEATNSHDYELVNEYENWIEILENRDWAALEQAWSDSNSAPGGEVM
jgi:hypothetical protein